MKRRRFYSAVVGGLLLVGCSQKAQEPFRDAPTARDRNSGPARVIEFPDGFSNMSAKCDGPNMVYSAFHGDNNRASMAVVANDPRCGGR